MAVTLDGQKIDLAPGWAQGIMGKAFEESVVGKLSQGKPISLSGVHIPICAGFKVGYSAETAQRGVALSRDMDKRAMQSLPPWGGFPGVS